MSDSTPKARGMTRIEAAIVLTTLCREALVKTGAPLAAFEITAQDVERALIERRGLGGGSEEAPTKGSAMSMAVESSRATDTSVVSVDTPGMSVDTGMSTDSELKVNEEVQRVWDGWLAASSQDKDLPIDVKSKSKIQERLAFGFSTGELVQACKLVLAAPSLVKRTRIRTVSKPLESDRRVCELLGKPFVPIKRVTWLTPFEDLWVRYYPQGEPPSYPVMGKWLAPLVERHGKDAVVAEVEQYLNTTSIAFISWPKFAAGYGNWSYGTQKRNGRSSYANDAMSGLE